MATESQRVASLLNDLRRDLYHALRQARHQSVAEQPDQREYHRGQAFAYAQAVDKLDAILVDDVVIDLVPAEEGPQ